jgi:uncharacterized protein YecE (DUF72 family)
VFVGVSGWTYAPWRGDFYPAGLPHRRELEHAASRLTSVEINGSFYSLQRPSSYAAWAAQTPEDFVFAVKGSRFITHMLKLGDVDVALANFFASGLLALGPKLGPILWQLPETFRFDADRLAAFFARLPRTTAEAARLAQGHDERLQGDRALTVATVHQPIRHALEFRSPTFDTEEARSLLRDHDVATVLADTAGRWPRVDADTGSIRYVRLHGDRELYTSGYTGKALARWADLVAGWAPEREVFCYFDNDVKGYAPHDAEALIRLLVDRGVAA